jgi:PIN domain nuclease of toxin-antitoxin system
MRLLLDTHAFLFWVYAHEELGEAARRLIADRRNEVFFSVASSWEMAIKVGLGKLKLDGPLEEIIPEELLRNGFSLLPIEHAHVLAVSTLPRRHGDPFDRLLISQARASGLTLVTRDEKLKGYGVPLAW